MKRKKQLRPMTAKNVDKWLRAGQPAKHLDRGSKDSVRGLMLDVRRKRAAGWILRYQLNKGPTRHMGLGSAFDFTLAQARERARRERQRLADGVDPLTVRRTEQAAARMATARRLTFAEAAAGWHEAQRPGWSSVKHAENVWDALAKWALPLIGRIDVAELDTKDVMRILQQPVDGKTLWTARTTTASRLANNLRQILDWSVAAEHRPGGANPAIWTGHLDKLLPKPSKTAPVVNLPAMPYTAVPALMAKLPALEGVAPLALAFLIHTASRINETVGARHDEIIDLDGDEPTWVVPAHRMKARKEWRQPLAPQVVALIKTLPTEEGNPYLFIGAGEGEGLSASAIRMLLRRLGHNDVVAHGFRSSFSDWAHERTAHSNHTIEISLAHSVGNEVEQAYRRGDMLAKRRKLMKDWAAYVTTPPVAAGDNVRPIRRQR
jgi:integrase